jgi:hypothetical protein
MRRFIPLLILLGLIFGASYASALINRMMGPWSATAVEHDGSLTHMQFGSDLPRPEWVPYYPGAWVVGGSRLTSERHPAGFHSLDLGTRASLDEVKRFYTEQLTGAGFEVSDLGLMGLNPMTAAYLGVDGTLSAKAVDRRCDPGPHPHARRVGPVAAAADSLAQDQRDTGLIPEA